MPDAARYKYLEHVAQAHELHAGGGYAIRLSFLRPAGSGSMKKRPTTRTQYICGPVVKSDIRGQVTLRWVAFVL